MTDELVERVGRAVYGPGWDVAPARLAEHVRFWLFHIRPAVLLEGARRCRDVAAWAASPRIESLGHPASWGALACESELSAVASDASREPL